MGNEMNVKNVTFAPLEGSSHASCIRHVFYGSSWIALTDPCVESF